MKFNVNLVIPGSTLLFLAVLLLGTSCKKDHPTQTQAVPNSLPASMTHIESFGTATLNFTYNADSTLKTISSTGYQYEPGLAITYRPGSLLIQRKLDANNDIYQLDSVSLNEAGHITDVRRFHNPEKTSWGNDRYTLNGSNEIVGMEQGVSTSDKTAKFNFTYVNGNLVHDATAALYLYDLKKPAQFGDRNSLMNFLTYGLKYPLSKNLVIGAVYGTDTTFYKYSYDKVGRIINYHQEQHGVTYTQYNITYQ